MKIIGIDEVGYGSWAGPILSAATLIDIPNFKSDNIDEIIYESNEFIKNHTEEKIFNLIKDSKKLSQKNRTLVYEYLIKNFTFQISFINNDEIDKINIRQANFKAMENAYNQLSQNDVDFILIDGNANPGFSDKITTIINGDSFSKLISISSIIAKVTRDKMMQDFHNEFPNYGWDSNVGYGTTLHKKGIEKHGITKYHRKSYKPIKEFL